MGISEESFYFGLDFFGEKVSLDCRDAFWGLGGDYVDAYDSSGGFGAFYCYLLVRGDALDGSFFSGGKDWGKVKVTCDQLPGA